MLHPSSHVEFIPQNSLSLKTNNIDLNTWLNKSPFYHPDLFSEPEYENGNMLQESSEEEEEEEAWT